jgi:class 3 adenylate cyclase/tetratricopeptide (TPR) repeat protein
MPAGVFFLLERGVGGTVALTENITVLFTDLVDSTELASALSVEDAEELRREHFSTLRQAVASTAGTEVKTLGDGVMVVFTSASAALTCAVAMQQAVERHTRESGHRLLLRVGISAGEAVREGDDYFGEPVVEASRLCGRAGSGEILVADLVRGLAGRRSPHRFTSMGAFELKGLPDPVMASTVAWEPIVPVEAPVPAPPRLERTPAIGVIGREAELSSLADGFKRTGAGEGREVVLISGEPGIGKTTLATQAARAAFEAGAVVLLGRCDEELSTPYGPFVEALSHYVTHAPEDALRVHVEQFGGELSKLVPVLRQRLRALPAPQSTDPDTERYLLFGAVLGLLGQIAEDTPLVIVLDDLQWADKPSLQLLRHVVANTTEQRLFVVATYRNEELSIAHPLTEALGTLRREPGVGHIALSGFDDTEMVAFMKAAAGHDLDRNGMDLARALYRETDGNPFFVWEVLRHLSETGAIYQDDAGRWMASSELDAMEMPDSVRLVIGSRVARLGPTVSHVLPLAAVIGREFDVDLLARVSEHPEEEVLDVLDAAAAAALVTEVSTTSGRYAFSHALIQHTLYQDLGATRRALAHRRVAEAIEAVTSDHPGARVGELAYHWCNAAQPVNADKAIAYARQAGDAALAALAPDEAVRYFSQALRIVDLTADDEPLLACDLRVGLGQAQRQAGIAASRETFLDAAQRARRLGATDQLVSAALANTRGWFSASGVVDTDKVAVLEAALDAVGTGDSAERALLLGTLCSELSFGPLDRRLELAAEAKGVVARLGEPATTVQVLSLLDNPLQIPSTLGERREDNRQAVMLAEALGDPEALYHAHSQCQVNAVQAGDFAAANASIDTMRAVSERLRQPTLAWMTLFKDAGMALMAGDPDGAEEAAGAAVSVGTESGQPDAFNIFGSQVMFVRMEQGRLGELVALVDQAVTDYPGIPSYRAILAAAHLDAGNHATALAMLDRAAADGFSSVPQDFIWTIGMTGYAQVATELRAETPAELLYDLLTPHHGQIPFIGTLGYFPTSCSLGGLATVLGRYDEADRHFADADELATRGAMRFYGAANQLWWGRMLVERGGRGDAPRGRRLLDQARTTAAGCGYALIGQRAERALSALS